MEPKGFIRGMLDLKILVLFVAGQLENPVELQTLYELCYVEETVTYFDFCTVVPELVQTEHLLQDADGLLCITPKGRQNCQATLDSIALTVRQRAEEAVQAYHLREKRRGLIQTQILSLENGDYAVEMTLHDGISSLMRLELMAPNDVQARRLERAFWKQGETIYRQVMATLLEPTEEKAQ